MNPLPNTISNTINNLIESLVSLRCANDSSPHNYERHICAIFNEEKQSHFQSTINWYKPSKLQCKDCNGLQATMFK